MAPALVLALACAPWLAGARVRPSAAAPADTLHYDVVISGLRAGGMTVVSRGDTLLVHWEYADRGNGPALDERLVFGAAGIPITDEISGVNYLKHRVHERFQAQGGKATWESPGESGRGKTGGVYVAAEGTPVTTAVLARALLRSRGGRLRLFPTGEARLRRLEHREVTSGDRRVGITLYAIDGLKLHPEYTWLDDAGRFFMDGSPIYGATVRQGFEAALPGLFEARVAADSSRTRELAARLTHRLERPLAIRHARLFVAEDATVLPGMTVVVEGDRFAAVGTDDRVVVPADAAVVEAGGRTLLPGLWDMHAHLAEDDGVLDIAAGVTTARDLANDSTALRRRMDRIAEGSLIGPRVMRAGIVDGRGPFTGPSNVLVSTPEEAVRGVDSYAAQGFVQLKIYGSVPAALVPVLVHEAHARGMRVSGHVPAGMSATDAVNAGFDEIQHIVFLPLNFMGDSARSADITAISGLAAAKTALLDLASDSVRAFVAFLKEHHTVIDPTLGIFQGMLTAREGRVGPGFEGVADRMPVQTWRDMRSAGMPVPAGMDQTYRASYETMARLVKTLYDAGVTVVPGTDAIAGFAFQRELEAWAAAGIPPAGILRAATIGAARVMGRDAELGSIRAGKLADLVLVDGDPTSHIGDIRRPVLVVTRGRMYRPAELLAAIGVRPRPGDVATPVLVGRSR